MLLAVAMVAVSTGRAGVANSFVYGLCSPELHFLFSAGTTLFSAVTTAESITRGFLTKTVSRP
jgi:hypothetical protein